MTDGLVPLFAMTQWTAAQTVGECPAEGPSTRVPKSRQPAPGESATRNPTFPVTQQANAVQFALNARVNES